MMARLVALCAVAIAGCTTRPPAGPMRWTAKFTHVYAASTDYQRMAERFRELMRERTGGRFETVIYSSGQLGDERLSFEQLRFGAQQIAISGTPVLSGWVPEGQVFDLPYLFAGRDEGVAALDGRLGDWWRQLLLDRTGVRSLGFLEYGFRHVYNRRGPVRRPEDLDGLKLRVLQNATYLRAYDALGAQPTPMAYSEVYSALQQGVIDGGESNAIGYVSDRLAEVAPYFSLTSVTYNPITLLVNDRFYQSLPEDVRAALDRSASDALAFQRQVSQRMTEEAMDAMRRGGVVVTTPDTAAFARRVRPRVWNELAAALPAGAELLDWLQRELIPGPVAAVFGPNPPGGGWR